MGATNSNPLILPRLSDASDDSDCQGNHHHHHHREFGDNNSTAAREEEKEEISIVFFDDDGGDATDSYRDERDDPSVVEYRCFVSPFFDTLSSRRNKEPAGATTTADRRFHVLKNKPGDDKNEIENENDEDPKEDIKTLQLELETAEVNYHRREVEKQTGRTVGEYKESDDDDDDGAGDPGENIESLRRELRKAERTYPRRRDASAAIDRGGGGEDRTTNASARRPLSSSSSLVGLRKLLFSSGNDDGEGSVSSSVSLLSGGVSDVYETRTTRLRPRPGHEPEVVPPEREGVPFRKCRNPACSCHHRTNRNNNSYNNYYYRHGDGNGSSAHDSGHHKTSDTVVTDDEEHSSMERLKRRSALLRLKKQRDKLLAMDRQQQQQQQQQQQHDDDDRTVATAGSCSSSSLYSGYSIRSDCQINSRNNHAARPRTVFDDCRNRGREQRSRSEDCAGAVPASAPPPGMALLVKRDAGNAVPPPCVPKTIPPQPTKQQQPPLPTRRFSGAGSGNRHAGFPLSTNDPRSPRKHGCSSCREGGSNGNEPPRRCRSEDYFDDRSGNPARDNHRRVATAASMVVGSSDNEIKIHDTLPVPNDPGTESSNSGVFERRGVASGKKRSFSAHADHTDPANEEERQGLKHGEDQPCVRSPTSIVEEMIHRNHAYRRSQRIRTNGADRQERQHQQQQHRTTDNTNAPQHPEEQRNRRRHRQKPTRAPALGDCPSPAFRAREKLLGEHRRSLRFLRKEETTDRRREMPSAQNLLPRGQKRRRRRQRKKDSERAARLAGLYHKMGLIHYQQGRYDTARHVLQCGIDALIANRSRGPGEPVVDPFDNDYGGEGGHNHHAAATASGVLPPLPTLDEAAPHLSNQALLLAAELVLAQGKICAAQGLWNETARSSGRVLQWSIFQRQRLAGGPANNPSDPRNHRRNHRRQHHECAGDPYKYWRDWGPTTARAQVLSARCYEREERPDIAMRYYREALSVQRSLLGHWHVDVADTIYRMGNLHASRGLLGLAGRCYDEALCLYQRHRMLLPCSAEAEQRNLAEGLPGEESRNVAADEAAVLAGLGWIYLVQNDPSRALETTGEALRGMVFALGSSHRNVVSLRQQMDRIRAHGFFRQRSPRLRPVPPQPSPFVFPRPRQQYFQQQRQQYFQQQQQQYFHLSR